jgi:predicted RNase H-like HicB family nuclease
MLDRFVDYKIDVFWDEETKQVVVDAPALGIADCAPDVNEALEYFREMATFHVECLLDEGEQLPESDEGEGVYIRVPLPVRAG